MIDPSTMKKRLKCHNKVAQELPATCLPLQDGGIPLSALKTCQFFLHIVSLMLSVKQGSCEYYFQINGLTQFVIKPESTAPETDAPCARPSELQTRY